MPSIQMVAVYPKQLFFVYVTSALLCVCVLSFNTLVMHGNHWLYALQFIDVTLAKSPKACRSLYEQLRLPPGCWALKNWWIRTS